MNNLHDTLLTALSIGSADVSFSSRTAAVRWRHKAYTHRRRLQKQGINQLDQMILQLVEVDGAPTIRISNEETVILRVNGQPYVPPPVKEELEEVFAKLFGEPTDKS